MCEGDGFAACPEGSGAWVWQWVKGMALVRRGLVRNLLSALGAHRGDECRDNTWAVPVLPPEDGAAAQRQPVDAAPGCLCQQCFCLGSFKETVANTLPLGVNYPNLVANQSHSEGHVPRLARNSCGHRGHASVRRHLLVPRSSAAARCLPGEQGAWG